MREGFSIAHVMCSCTNRYTSAWVCYPTLLSALSSKRVLSSRFRVPNK